MILSSIETEPSCETMSLGSNTILYTTHSLTRIDESTFFWKSEEANPNCSSCFETHLLGET